jgi:hypothetical protein
VTGELKRRPGLADAITIGAGVFTAWAPAAEAAGRALLIGLVLAPLGSRSAMPPRLRNRRRGTRDPGPRAYTPVIALACVETSGGMGCRPATQPSCSGVAVLTYCAITKAAAFVLPDKERRWPRWI